MPQTAASLPAGLRPSEWDRIRYTDTGAERGDFEKLACAKCAGLV